MSCVVWSKDHIDCSIIIPAYNVEKYLNETLISITNSTGVSFEIIIVNDGSTDNTEVVALQLAKLDQRIKHIKQPNSGASAARNTGLKYASAPLICFLDADDRLRPNALKALCGTLSSNPDAVGAYGGVCYFDNNSRVQNYSSKYGKEVLLPVVTLAALMQSNFVDTPGAILFRRAIVERIGGFDPNIRFGEDWELYVRAAQFGDFVYCNESVIDYRQHTLSAMHHKKLTLDDFEPALAKVFDMPATSYGLSTQTLRLYEQRMKVQMLRVMILKSRGPLCQLKNSYSIVRLMLVSRFDKTIRRVAIRSVISAAKRFL